MAQSVHGRSLLRPALLCVFHLLLIHPTPSHASRPLPTSGDKPAVAGGAEFIKSSCSTTTFPDLCLSSLHPYARSIDGSPALLARTALSVSLDRARSAAKAMRSVLPGRPMSPTERGAMGDCMENVSDAIRELQVSLGEMGNLRGKDVGFKINGIQTWVSAALTDDGSCMDGFAGKAMEGSGVRNAVKGQVTDVAHLTSNALALISALASAQQSSVAGATP